MDTSGSPEELEQALARLRNENCQMRVSPFIEGRGVIWADIVRSMEEDANG